VFLLYLTYGLYSWDVSEPISYLLALGLETIALYYFIRKGYQYSQSNLFKKKYETVLLYMIESILDIFQNNK
jgi:hypothetical protein